MTAQTSYGIDAISVYIPKLYLDMTNDFARVRYLDSGCNSPEQLAAKVAHGIGISKMSVPDAHEDPVTMAAMAAKDLIEKSGISPKDVAYVAVATESGVDQSKSAAAYVIGMLENYFDVSFRSCLAPQYQFACAGAMYALESALNLFRSGEMSDKKYAIVIATDIAKYELRSSGEPTQGAGAVALLVSANPRLLAFEPQTLGVCTRDERDFFRPNWRRTAVVDGKYSTQVYLDVMEQAFNACAEKLLSKPANQGKGLSDLVARVVCHVPFPKMAEYMAARFLPVILRSRSDGLGCDLPEIPKGAPDATLREHEKALRAHPTFRKAFQEYMADALAMSGQVGNIYSGSLFLALASLLEKSPASVAGSRVLVCSYGSGATSLVNSAIIQPGFKSAQASFQLAQHLATVEEGGRRVRVSFAEYEYLHGLEDVDATSLLTSPRFMPRKSILEPREEFFLSGFGTEESNFGLRLYRYANSKQITFRNTHVIG